MLNIVLFEPEIPANTGNIGRTCVATGTRLHLIEPLGFRINEKSLKRAGMDYWKDLDVTTYINYQDFLDKNPGAKIYMATTKAHKVYTEVDYEQDCYIMFGKESAGIPEEILVDHEEDCMRIPMIGDIRSLNLGNAFLNGATPANDYTPSQPYSITLTQDSVVDEDQIYIPANPSIPSPDQYRAFIYCKASDSGKWIDVYKSSKDGNWYMYKWMDLITSIKAPASSNPF